MRGGDGRGGDGEEGEEQQGRELQLREMDSLLSREGARVVDKVLLSNAFELRSATTSKLGNSGKA